MTNIFLSDYVSTNLSGQHYMTQAGLDNLFNNADNTPVFLWIDTDLHIGDDLKKMVTATIYSIYVDLLGRPRSASTRRRSARASIIAAGWPGLPIVSFT